MRAHSFACFAALSAASFLSAPATAQPPAVAPGAEVPAEGAAPAEAIPTEGAAPVETAASVSLGAELPQVTGGVIDPVPVAAPPLPAMAPPALEPVAAEAPTVAPQWYESAEYRVFVDSYASLNWNFPKPQTGTNGQGEVRAYDQTNGFALSWVGADLSLPAAPVGGMLSLRFGPTAQRYSTRCFSGKCDADYGLGNVKQAFASYSPVAGLSLDLGKFDTIYGAEVAESQDNMNYTRGVLYWLGQPLFHTGLRAEYQATKELAGTLLIVNGWNNSVDNNAGKSFGLQGKYATSDEMLSVALGYLGGPERDDTDVLTCEPGFELNPASGCQPKAGAPGGVFPVDRADSDTKGWRHFVDLVVGLNPIKDFAVLANLSYGIDYARNPQKSSDFVASNWWGGMLGARYDLGQFGVGARGEYFGDRDGFAIPRAKSASTDGAALMTGTLTLDADLAPGVVLKLDNRFDWADRKLFQSGIRKAEGTEFTSTLGFVASVP